MLIEYADQRADAALTSRVEAHLATGCGPCTEQLSTWTRVLEAVRADAAPGPPDNVVRRALALYSQFQPEPTLWQRLVATLVFDSRMQPLAVGARDAGGTSFKLLFEAEGVHVDLFTESVSGRWTVAGQVLAPPPSERGWRVVAAGPAGQAETETDPLGEFALPGLTAGVYELTLQQGTCEIVLPGIELSAP